MKHDCSQYGQFADVYDLLMRDVDYDAWAEYIKSLLDAHEDMKRVLDCACGTGAISLRLANMGYDVIGLDSSADMLRVAAQKARSAGFALPFVQQDMCDIRLHRPVDAVVCACDGVNYLTKNGELCAFLNCARAALRPGGLLLFDISTIYKLEHVLSGNTFGDAGYKCAYIWQNSFDAKSGLCQMELTCFKKQGMLYERFDEKHIQRGYSIDEIANALEAAHFGDISVYGAFSHEYPANDCQRVQFLAKLLGDF